MFLRWRYAKDFRLGGVAAPFPAKPKINYVTTRR